MRVQGVALLGVLAFGSGCSSLTTDIQDRQKTSAELAREDKLCLGVTVARESAPLTIGLEVVRVLKEGPAAEAGIKPGDEIRSVAGEPVRTADDLERVLSHVDDTARHVEVVVAQRGSERICRANLITWKHHDSNAAAALALDVLNNKRSFTFPIVFDLERCPARGAWRLLILSWPLRFTSIAEEDSSLELAPGEDKLVVL